MRAIVSLAAVILASGGILPAHPTTHLVRPDGAG